MSIILNKLKKQSRTNLETISKKFKEDNYSNSYRDDRYWQPVVDKSNNGNATIRFLPPVSEPTKNVPVAEDVPYVRLWKHGFKDKGGWYIENSLTTIGKQDPIGELNNEMWNSGIQSKKDLASKRKRRLLYISNILVIKNPGRPEDEGKVFLYAYPKAVYDKIKSKMLPEEDDIDPIDVFDLWEGCNFRLRIRDKEGFRNYDTSEWDAPSPVSEDDDKIEEIYTSEYSLQAEVAPDKFKSYEELQKQLDRALGLRKNGDDEDEPVRKTKRTVEVEEDETDDEVDEVVEETPRKAKKVDEPEEDEADFFKKLKRKK